MTQPLILPPTFVPIIATDGRMHPMWRTFFDGLLSRVYGSNGELQAHDATLDALAALSATPGFLRQTGADTFTKQALGLSGTVTPVNSITAANGIITAWA